MGGLFRGGVERLCFLLFWVVCFGYGVLVFGKGWGWVCHFGLWFWEGFMAGENGLCVLNTTFICSFIRGSV